jgi:serine protease Do
MHPVLVFSAVLIAQADPQAASLARRRSPIVEVVERAGPAVVNIATEVVDRNNPFSRRRAADDVFREFFGSPELDRARTSLGSGVIIDPSGLVLTNEHVVSRATNVTITLADRRTFEVDVVGADPQFDLAVLKVRGQVQLPTVELGSSGDLMPGETVVAIGNPFGLANSVTTGVVSALHRSIQAEERTYEDFIQTDAAINPGNSGGALVNLRGELIGINTAIASKSGGYAGIGFAIPTNMAKPIMEMLVRDGRVVRGFLGVNIQTVTPAIAKELKLGAARGALIADVQEDSPASKAGLVEGDVVTAINGSEVRNGDVLRNTIAMIKPGTTVELEVVARSSGKKTIKAKLGTLPEPKPEVLRRRGR